MARNNTNGCPGPQLAIANPDRRTLQGPEFLDALIRPNSSEDIAVEYLDENGITLCLTYSALLDASQVLANRLSKSLGSFRKTGTIIPVILPQGPLLYISYLGVLRAGAAFCPILPDTPEERLHFILDDVQAEIGLCMPSMLENLISMGLSMICMPITLEECLNVHSPCLDDTRSSRSPSDLAYVMYTSGSTGKPKGVPISHYAVTQSLLAHDEHITSFLRFFQFAAPTFDVSIFEIFFTWYRGAILVTREREATLTDLCGTLNHLAIDAIELTPTVVSSLLRTRDAVPGLKLLLTIGEMLNTQIIKEFGGSEFRSGILYAMYGPTEAAIHCTILPNMEASSSVNDIGRPLSTVTTFVIEESHAERDVQLCYRERPGELAIAGQLADGYLNRPSETKSAFVSFPNYGMLYRTGDRAVMLQDGTLQILGRISDGQVKLRGQRIELGEIESVALQTEGVSLAAALIIQDTLVLFCSGSSHLLPAHIEHRCKAWLPRHMRPGQILVLEEGMPCLPSGKVNRKALEERHRQDSRNDSPTDPGNDRHLRSWIRDMVTEELGIVVNDRQALRFSGLTSMRAIRIAAKLRQHFPRVSISTVLEAETIKSLFTALERQLGDMSSSVEQVTDEIEQDQLSRVLRATQEQWMNNYKEMVTQALPCSTMQNAMLAETSRNGALNFSKIVLTSRRPVKLMDLLRALKEVAGKNPILRAAFGCTTDPSVPFVQLIRAEPSFEGVPSMANPLILSQGQHDREFVATIHHAVYDGWSWDLIMNDLNASLLEEPLPDRPSYQKFTQARFQRQRAGVDITDWTEMLQETTYPTFPTLCLSSSSDTSRVCHSTTLSTSVNQLSTAAVRSGVTMATIIHAVLSLLLATYLDTDTVLTGLVLSGREPVIRDVGDVIGPCLSTLPLLIKIHDQLTFDELVQHTYERHLVCHRQPFTSLSEIVSALNLSPDTRLFDVLFVWQESPHASGVSSKADLTTVGTCDHLEYAIVVEVEPEGNSVEVKTTHDTTKLSSDQISCFHSQLNALIDKCIHNPTFTLDSIPRMLPPKLLSLSLCQSESPTDDLTSTLVKAATQSPDSVAIDFVTDFDPATRKVTHQVMTYQELLRGASQVAGRLTNKHGLARDDIVAICCEKSPALYQIICATILAGIAYLCIDSKTPKNRTLEIFRQARPKAVVIENRDDSFSHSDCECQLLDLERLVSDDGDEVDLFPLSKGSDLAYAVFTSGSTGTPKGVLVTRDNLASNIRHLSSVYPREGKSRLLQSCSLAFDVSVFEIFWTWCCGLTLCCSTNDVLFRDLEGFIDTLEISHLSMTPSVAALVHPDNVPTIKFLVCAGEPMSAKVYEIWAGRGLHQGYGPSETTNICNVRHYVHGPALINNVGPQFPNTSVFVAARRPTGKISKRLSLDDLRILPRGAHGEFWIGGQQVARGYADPQFTQRSFLNHPTYGRLFRSGDFGRMLPDGSLIITGREDDQVKIRGQRIELKEIDSVVMQSKLVVDCSSLIVPGRDTRQRLVTFCVCSKDVLQGVEKIIDKLYDMISNTLPAYMVPESLIPVSKLPLTSQSKIDKRALVSEYHAFSEKELAVLSPGHARYDNEEARSEAEHTIARVLADMMEVKLLDISLESSFLSYGIDSVRAIAFARRLRDVGFSDIEVSKVLNHPSVRRLALALSSPNATIKAMSDDLLAEKAVPSVVRVSVLTELRKRGLSAAKVLPCTSIQAAMLSAHELYQGRAYQNHLVYRLVEDYPVVKQAWRELVSRVDLLRTMFAHTDDAEHPYVQVVLEDYDLPWSDIDQDHTVYRVAPFEQPPYLLRLKSRPIYTELHLFIHHALYDGQALELLQHDVETLCAGRTLESRPRFSKYLAFMLNADKDDSNKFWKDQLGDFAPSLLSRSRVQSRKSENPGHTRERTNVISWARVSTCAKNIAVTPLSIFQTALARLLSGHTATQDVCSGTVFSGRNVDVPDVDKIIGPCFNTLPSRVQLRSHQTSKDVCRHFCTYNLAVLPYQATSLRKLQHEYSHPRSTLFDIILLFQSASPKLNDKVWSLVHEDGNMAFPFIMEVQFDTVSDTVDVRLHVRDAATINMTDGILSDFITLVLDTVEHHNLPALNHIPSPLGLVRVPATIPNDRKYANGNTQKMPSTPVSRQVEQIMRSKSRKKFFEISDETTIFHLGFDSLSTIQLAAELRVVGFQVSANELLAKATISEIIKICEQNQGMQRSTTRGFDLDAFDKKHRHDVLKRLELRDEAVEAVWPCTTTQMGILSEYVNSNGSRYYNCIRLRLDPGVDTVVLEDKLQALIKLHVMLRIGFLEVNDIDIPYSMVVYAHHNAHLEFTNDEDAGKLRPKLCLQDLSRPPWHVDIHRNKDHLVVDLHMLHALYDATSLQIILSDLATLCQGDSVPKPTPVERALSLIVASNHSEIGVQDLLHYEASKVQTTRFPNLNVLNIVNSRFLTNSLELVHTRADLQSHCQTLGCRVSDAFQAAWAQLLLAYTGQRSVTFGHIVSGRSFDDRDLNEVVFPCINVLPIMVDMEETESTVVEQVMKANSRLRKNLHVPLSKLKRACHVEDDLFDTVLMLHASRSATCDLPWQIESESASTEYAVSLEIVPDADKFVLHLTFDQAILPFEHSLLLLRQYEMNLCESLKLESRESATKHLLDSVRPPLCKIIEPDVDCLHHLVLSTAGAHPESIALELVTEISGQGVDRQSWTYQQLVSEANRISTLLNKSGACVGDMVGLSCEKSPRASFALLGILMAGCAYVAIDPESPPSRKAFIVKDAGCNIVLTTSSVVRTFEAQEDTVALLCIDDDDVLGLPTEGLDAQERALVSPTDTCYCLYTSGTTGTPKGCLISHRSAVQAMLSFSRIFEGHWAKDARWLQFASYHFDVSVLEHFWSWKEGICVSIIHRDLLFEDLPGTIRKAGITHLDLTPSLARLLTPHSAPSLCKGVFIVGGEQVGQDIIDTWGDAGCLYNFYGPSEVTIGCTVHARVRKGVRATNIGRQWDNVGSHVLEPGTENSVPIGAVGELCLSGVLVGKGYLNRLELSREKFTVLKANGERVYRTGDLVRMLHDESFDFLGRIDGQVKLRGQRLETGEINHALLQCADNEFTDATTIVARHPQQEKEHLVAFLGQDRDQRSRTVESTDSAVKEHSPSFSKLRNRLSDRLPGYMIPTYFIAVHSLPLTVNNKVDLKALESLYARMSLSDVRTQQGHRDAKSSMVSRLHADFTKSLARSLGIKEERLDSTSSLLQLGIDSISAIGLVRLLKKAGYVNVSVAMILQSPIVADLATRCCDSQNVEFECAKTEQQEAIDYVKSFADRHAVTVQLAMSCEEANLENIAPCTGLQEGMISNLLADDSKRPPYMTKFVFRLDAMIDLNRLEAAWTRLQEQLDILRTYFVPTEDGFAQVVQKTVGDRALKIDLDGDLVSDDILAQIESSFIAWVESSRGLGSQRPWKAVIVRNEGNESYYMSIFMFHGIYDGISMRRMLDLLHQFYSHTSAQNKTLPFYQALTSGPLLRKHDSTKFWKDYAPQVHLLDLRRAYEVTRDNGNIHNHQLEFSITHITRICSELAVTPQAVLHATWLLTLAESFGSNPTIGIVLSGRSIELEQGDEVIGPLFNTLPFHISDLPERARLDDLIKACHLTNIQIMPYQHTSISSIRKSLDADSRQALFDTLFVYQTGPTSIPTEKPWIEVQTQASAVYPLNVEIEKIDNDRYSLRIVADAACLDATAVSNLLESFKSKLEALATLQETVLPACFLNQSERMLTQGPTTVKRHLTLEEKHTWTTEGRRIRTVLAALAGVEPHTVGLYSPTIFELGLDSVDALKLAARLKEQGIRVPVGGILRNPTIEGISRQAKKLLAPESAEPKTSLPFNDMQTAWREQLGSTTSSYASRIQLILPTTPLQQGMLLEYECYYNAMILKVTDADVTRLVRAIHETVNTTAILRTSFATVMPRHPGEPAFLQLVAEPLTSDNSFQISYHLQDLSALEAFVVDLQRESNITESRPRLNVVCLQNGSVYLTIGMSHASYDAWSIGLVLEKIQNLYADGHAPENDTQLIADYVSGLRQEHKSSETITFWSNRLKNARPSLVPVEHDAPSLPAMVKERCSRISLHEIALVCRRQGITLQSLTATVWALCLMTLTQQLNVSFGVIASGRTTEDLESLNFPAFNTVIFNFRAEPRSSKHDIVQKVHDALVEMFDYQQFPLSKALEIAGKRGKGLFNTLFTFQKIPTTQIKGDILFEEIALSSRDIEISPPYAVNVEAQEKEENLVWTIAIQKGVMSAQSLDEILDFFDRLLEQLISIEDTNIVQEKDGKVSISGMPPFAASQADRMLGHSHETKLRAADTATFSQETGWAESESKIRDVLVQVAHVDPMEIAKDTSLYNLGLDSVSAIKISGLLRDSGLKIPVSMILRQQTIANIAAAMRDVLETGNQSNRAQNNLNEFKPGLREQLGARFDHVGITHDDVEDVSPTTGGQEYMLNMWRASNGRLFYATFSFEVQNCDQQRFRAAFDQVVQEVPALRTKFICHAGETYQTVFKSAAGKRGPVQYEITDFSNVLVVGLHIHHALYDAISLDLVVRRLKQLCSTNVDAPTHRQPHVDTRPFLDALQLREAGSRHFWTLYLKGAKDIPDRAATFEATRTELFVPELLSSREIESRARREALSVQAIFFATVGRIYACARTCTATGHEDEVVVGIYLANRSLDVDDLAELVAPTFNIVPLRIKTATSIPLLEAARHVQSDLQKITRAEHCGISLGKIYKWTGVRIDCCINFLRLPDMDAGTLRTKIQDIDGVEISHAEGELREHAKALIRAEQSISPFVDEQGLEEAGTEWCLPALDVEAKVDDKSGMLGVGMFAPCGMFDDDALKVLMEALRGGLCDVAGE